MRSVGVVPRCSRTILPSVFGGHVQPFGVVGGRMQGVVVLLDQVTQLDQDRMPKVNRPRPARTGPGRLEPGGEDQQDLQVGEHDLAKGKVTLGLLLSECVRSGSSLPTSPVRPTGPRGCRKGR